MIEQTKSKNNTSDSVNEEFEIDLSKNTENHFKINSLSELKSASSGLFSEATQIIQLFTKDLDPRILNDREIELRLTQFVKRSRVSKMQILIYDESLMRGQDHRLVSLAQRFTSYVELRVVPKDYHENYFGFYLVDNKQMIYRSNIERYEAEYAKLPYSLVKEKSKWFDSVWQMSSPASFLRALHL